MAAKKRFASKMKSIVSAVKVAQRLEVRIWKVKIEHQTRAVLCYRIVLIKMEFGWVDQY